MPAIDDFIIGPIVDIYVGNYSDVSVLTWLPAPRTQGGRFRYVKPEQWEVAIKNRAQTGNCSVSMDLTFFWSEDVHRIAMTNPLGATNLDDPPTGNEYVVLLLAPDPDSRSSILLPRCVATCDVQNPFSKTDVTTIPIIFGFEERNKHTVIYRRGTYDELATVLGARSPI